MLVSPGSMELTDNLDSPVSPGQRALWERSNSRKWSENPVNKANQDPKVSRQVIV